MISSIRVSNRAFYRTLTLTIPYGLMLVATLASLIRLSQGALSPVDYLTDSLKLGVLGVLYFAFAGYELTSMLRKFGGQECLSTIPGAQRDLLFSHILTLLPLLAVWSALIFGGQVIGYFRQGLDYPPFLLHCLLAVVLYCLLPGLAGLLLGACLERAGRPAAYGAIVLAALLSSSVCDELLAGSALFGVSPMAVFDWFYLTVPNGNWVADASYGVAMEACRWCLAAFWCLVLTAVLLWRFRRCEGRAVPIAAVILLATAMLCAARFVLRGGDDLLIKDSRPDGILSSELQYRTEHPAGEFGVADFSVEEYDLNITAKGALKVAAMLKLNRDDLREYRFTLYHGYEVLSVTDGRGQALQFTRDGDFLDISAPNGTKALTVIYGGRGWKYLANTQAITLPGYFAYYPMPGHLALWTDGGAQAVTGLPPARFRVEVDSPQTVFSNLPKTGRNVFEGTAEAVTLYAGLVDTAERDGTTYVFSPVSRTQIEGIDLERADRLWREWCEITGETRTLDLAGKTIFIQPDTISASGKGDSESVVVFDDHILLANMNSTPETICGYYMMDCLPRDAESGLLRDVFTQDLVVGIGSWSGEKPDYGSLQILQEYPSIDALNEIGDEEQWFVATEQYTSASERFRELYAWQCGQLGRETVLREVYRYLKDGDPSEDQVIFLYNLGGGINAGNQ